MDYLTVGEAAALLGVSVSTIKKRIKHGRMPAERFGGRVLMLPRAEIEAMQRGKWRAAALEKLEREGQ